MEPTSECPCEVKRGEDGRYYVTAGQRDLVMIRKFKRLSPSWQRMIIQLLDSVLSQAPADPNVIPFPYGRRKTDRPVLPSPDASKNG